MEPDYGCVWLMFITAAVKIYTNGVYLLLSLRILETRQGLVRI